MPVYPGSEQDELAIAQEIGREIRSYREVCMLRLEQLKGRGRNLPRQDNVEVNEKMVGTR